MIALVDYGAGNLASVRKALAAVGGSFRTPAAPSELSAASAIVLPGVGHFAATAALDDAWRSAIRAAVARQVPLLGICLGMHWLFDGSEEAPDLAGLGLLPGRCVRLADTSPDPRHEWRVKVPHVGWNALEPRASRVLADVTPGAQVYFSHSYAAPVTGDCVAITTHAAAFAAAVERGLIFGVQFHPEKSGAVGLRVLRNFLDATAA